VADRRWWRRFTTVRARTTVAATLVVGVALGLVAVAVLLFLHRSLVENVDDAGEIRAEDVAVLARHGTLPATLPVAGDDDHVIQVVDDSGRVVSASASGGRQIAGFRPSGWAVESRTVGGFRVAALRTGTPDGMVTVYVATNLRPVAQTTALVRGVLVAGGAVLLVLVVVTASTVVGRALRPVETIRAEVAEISERSLARRVPVPATDDEIGRLAGTMNAMLDRLHAAAERQRRFVADASHELRTPLAAVRTDLEVALAHPGGTDWRQTATDVLTANQRMERLVHDLLLLAREDSAAPAAPKVPVDLDDLVLAEAARLRAVGRVRVDTSAVSAAAVDGRPGELTRAVRNLFDNAGRYAVDLVTVSLRGDGPDATLVIADDGPGIPPADRARVFERFSRLDEARDRDRGGTGLGLAITREIVEAHGGTVTVLDATGGARFLVRLPAR
jgi:signal transduction histidine kinase